MVFLKITKKYRLWKKTGRGVIWVEKHCFKSLKHNVRNGNHKNGKSYFIIYLFLLRAKKKRILNPNKIFLKLVEKLFCVKFALFYFMEQHYFLLSLHCNKS